MYIVFVAWDISGAGRVRTEYNEPGIEEKSALHSED